MTIRMGIDLGGTKIEGVLLDGRGAIVERARVPTPQNDYTATLLATADLIGRLEQIAGAAVPVGVGMPGSVSTVTGAMKNCNSTCLNGQFFGRDLSERVGRPVAVANDADCFALSEAVDGAGAEANRVFGVILGTGVGGGIVEGKRPLSGPNGLAGEWGHNLLPAEARGLEGPPRPCFCGRNDCNEMYLSGPGLARTHSLLHPGQSDGDAAQIVAAAESGEGRAEKTLEIYVEQLAYALSQVINLLDPDVVVLGGGVSNAPQLYREGDGVAARWHRWIFSDAVETTLRPARYGDSSGVRGAAWLNGDVDIAAR